MKYKKNSFRGSEDPRALDGDLLRKSDDSIDEDPKIDQGPIPGILKIDDRSPKRRYNPRVRLAD